MRILLIILCLIAKYMTEADPKFWLVDTLDGKSNTNGVEFEKNDNEIGEDYQETPGQGDTVKCTGKTVWNCCSSTDPCQENQGDCDENDDCAGSLICGNNNCNKLDSRAHKDSDCCINPEAATTTGPESTSRPPINNKMSSCERSPVVVKDVATLTNEERTNLLEGFRELLNSTDEWYDIGGLHFNPVRPACDMKPCCKHNNHDDFLPFHRLYLAYINSALRRKQPNTVIPYWDWSLGGQFPSIAQSSDSPFFRAPVNATPPRYTSRSGTQIDNFLDKIIDALANENDFRLFTNQLERIHADIHIGIGGDMGRLEDSGWDPIFHLHHTMVDLIWAVQQTIMSDVRPTRGFNSILKPFGLRGTDTFQCQNYDLESGIVFANMTLAQIREEVAKKTEGNGGNSTDYQDKIPDKVYAGFFLESMDVSGLVKFNICKSINNYQSEDCSIPAGEFVILGGKGQTKDYNSLPIKIDVTEAVAKAGLNATSMCRFKVTSFLDVYGKERPDMLKELYQPITVFRKPSEKKDTYLFAFNKEGKQAPDITIHKGCSYQIDSEEDDVDENQECYGNSTNSANTKKEWLSYEEWQLANSDKYQKWNTKGTHTFSTRICNDQSYRGTKIKINCE